MRGALQARAQRDVEYVAFVDARRALFVRTAYLLCGDWHRAEDLVQSALVRLYGAWRRLARTGGEEAYVRRILINANIDDWRRRRRRPEAPLDEALDHPAPHRATTEDRDALRRALAALPEGQRKVLVLRFYLDQSVEETAADLGVTTGTVKSQSARALARLREQFRDEGTQTSGEPKGNGP
jgi:RNA polymerase sigma-70 factor (sigma-E family)